MITEWGMSDRLGFLYYGDDPIANQPRFDFGMGKEFSDKTSEAIDEEAKRIIDEACADARRLIQENRAGLEAVAQALLKYETLSGEEIRRVMAGETLDRPTVADLIAVEQDRRPEALPVARPVQKPPSDPQTGPLPTPA
jgi:cell division protease FtsH